MTLSRRKTLALIGGGVVVAASAGAAGFAATRSLQKVLQPWQTAGQYRDPRLRALSYALLAPNPHNLQPWTVALEGEDTVVFWHDRTRRLAQTDPYDRQLTIGFGCFLELMTMAAAQEGKAVEAHLFPEGDEGPIFRAVFSDGATPDPLAAAILDRRSCKKPFDPAPVAEADAAALAPYARIVTEPGRVAELRDLTWQAWMVEMTLPRTLTESVDLMRFGKAEINANPDGIDLGGPMLEGMMLAGLVTRAGQADPASGEFQQAVKMYRQMLYATPAYAVITTPDNSRADQIAAGRQWLRLNLAATRQGLSLHPVSQALQEYPEMAKPYATAHSMLAPEGGTVQMLGRLGYGPRVAASPRWPLEAKLSES